MEPLPRGKEKKDKVCVRKGHMGKLHIYAWKEGIHRLISGIWVLIHRAGPTNNKNWKSLHSQSVLMSSGSWSLNGIASMTGRVSWKLFKEKMEKNVSCTFLQSISLFVLRSTVKPETYLTGNSWSKAKAKETWAMQPGPVTHHLFKRTMKWIMLYTNNNQKWLNYQTWSSLETHGIVQTILDQMGDKFLMQILERTNKGNILCDLCTQTWKKSGKCGHR